MARKVLQVADAMPTAPEFLVTTLIPALATAMGTAHTLVIHATAGYTVLPINAETPPSGEVSVNRSGGI